MLVAQPRLIHGSLGSFAGGLQPAAALPRVTVAHQAVFGFFQRQQHGLLVLRQPLGAGGVGRGDACPHTFHIKKRPVDAQGHRARLRPGTEQVTVAAHHRAEQRAEGKAREQVRSRYANPCRRRRQTAFCCLYIRAPAQHLGRGSDRDARTHGRQRAGLCQLLIERRRWLPGEYCQPVQAQLHIGLTLRHRRAQGIQLRLRSHPIKLGTAAGIQPGGDDIQ